MKKSFLIPLLMVLPMVVAAAEPGAMALSERYSYAMGVRLGEALKTQGVRQVDSAALAAAIDDVILGRPLRLTAEQMRSAIREQRSARDQANLAAGQAYLAENGRRPGVVTLPSGLQYEVLQAGDGDRPSASDTVRVHYHGTRIDGVVFDSSESRGQPAEFPLDGVIAGFREAISRMRTGGRWRVVVPSDLAYGVRGAGGDIGPNETLIFEISLLEIMR